MLTLYESCFSSSPGKCNGKWCSCLSRPYYDGIIVFHKLSNRELIHDDIPCVICSFPPIASAMRALRRVRQSTEFHG